MYKNPNTCMKKKRGTSILLSPFFLINSEINPHFV